jgi:hypothetical protein
MAVIGAYLPIILVRYVWQSGGSWLHRKIRRDGNIDTMYRTPMVRTLQAQ